METQAVYQTETMPAEPTLQFLEETQRKWLAENEAFFQAAESVAYYLGKPYTQGPRYDIQYYHYDAGNGIHLYLAMWEGNFDPQFNAHVQNHALQVTINGDFKNPRHSLVCNRAYNALDGRVTSLDPFIVPGQWMDPIRWAVPKAAAAKARLEMTDEQIKIQAMKDKLLWGRAV